MVTRTQVGTVKPNPYFHGHTSHISPIPKSPSVALSYPNWRDAMYDEYNALIKNSTWVLVLKPPNVNVVQSMWLFRHKYHADGSLSSTVLSLALSQNWPIHQLDVKNAFLNGDLSKTVYMYQPLGILLSQKKYVLELLDRAHMANCNPTQTSIDTESKLGSDRDLLFDPTLYRSLAGGLQYPTFTHPKYLLCSAIGFPSYA
nr:ribonuclease H-like domain-containing protein [Tanacetum cinerariifolium]